MFRLSRKKRNRRTTPSPIESLETRILPATIVVNSLADVSGDDSSITLREAIEAANNDATVNGFNGSYTGDGADVIEFSPGLVQSLNGALPAIHLNDGPLEIRSEITINGSAFDRLIIDGRLRDRVIDITSEGTANIENVIIQRGRTQRFFEDGAGIRNSGTLYLKDSIVTRNDAQPAANVGGGIYNSGYLEMQNVALSNNLAASGSPLYNDGTVVANALSVYTNFHTYMENRGDMTLSNSTLWNEGLVVSGRGPTTLVNSTILGSWGITNGLRGDYPIELHNTIVDCGGCTITQGDTGTLGNGQAGIHPDSSNNFISFAVEGTFDAAKGNQVGTQSEPLVAPLNEPEFQDAMLVMQPVAGSSLIDTGNDAEALTASGDPARYDITGLSRNYGTVDIGPVEFNPLIELSFDGTQHLVQFAGTDADDAVVVVPTGPAARISIGTDTFPINSDQLVNPKWEFDLKDGTDQLRLHFHDWADVVISKTEVTANSGDLFDLTATNAEHVRTDFNRDEPGRSSGSVVFNGTDADDTFVVQNRRASMLGPDYSFIAKGFDQISAIANGGHNIAQIALNDFNDSLNANLLAEATSSGQSTISATGSDGQVEVSTHFFDDHTVWANPSANADATDFRSTIYGSVGNDVFETGPGYSRMTTADGITHVIHGALEQTGLGGTGGRDIATIRGSELDDNFNAAYGNTDWAPFGIGNHATAFSGDGISRRVAQFDAIIMNPGGGNDSVTLGDSPQDDIAVFAEGYAVIRSRQSTPTEDFFLQANDFEHYEVRGSTTGGGNVGSDHDELQLLAPTGDNRLVVTPQSAVNPALDEAAIELYDGSSTRQLQATDFATVKAIATTPGEHTLDLDDSLDYEFQSFGDWI